MGLKEGAIMRVADILTMVLVMNLAAAVRAAGPATQPSTTTLSPKDTFLSWPTPRSVDDVLLTYAFSEDKQKAFAQVTAEEVIAFAKIQKAVDAKWGKGCEAVVMHACGSDTREDDEQAQETVTDDHAIIKFRREGIAPLFLVRVDGQWKVDIAIYVATFGDNLTDIEGAVRQITAIVDSATAALAAGKYSDADHLAKDLASQIDKVQ